ncbi:leucine--tRNA ligase [Anseongella ginsenosidimutans]|nr:leucine--tRNA ligase [Anseongella ginsenosidimutans]QEC54234.1 leucine--tRNA ligase [Anseongella ginsenosidimutans]
MDYNFRSIEKKWQGFWAENQTFKAETGGNKPKYYVLDMFPYPSGAGLHVGHPLGYIASDILARFKRLKGFNVLHPMGYDAFGLPAEQYAIQTGQHPALTTDNNIRTFRRQLDNIGLSFDWSREVRTSDPDFYKWTQWIFIRFFHSWYNKKTGKAEAIDTLINEFEQEGNARVEAASGEVAVFTAPEWKAYSEKEKEAVLQHYRLAYQADAYVNWCPRLGTVLANDEVQDGLSVRGGYPVERKLMRQWFMRITAYAERLLNDLEEIDWPEPIKEMQRNWIGRSEGAMVRFELAPGSVANGAAAEPGAGQMQERANPNIEVFTTRPDTIFGCTFLVLAPEHELVDQITSAEQLGEVRAYVQTAKNRSERDRMADVKTVSGAFTGAYALHPFTGEKIPVWIADYVLAGYGTGAVMAVPSGDNRDFRFARHFNLPIPAIAKDRDISEEAYEGKDAIMINSGFLNGMTMAEAIGKAIEAIEKKGIGKGKIQYRLRDAAFSRQRYWGEPFPLYYKDGIPHTLGEDQLPLVLPEVDKYLPTESGEPPLARAKDWQTAEGYPLETNTMPGWAGSSWYYLRYMDAENAKEFAGHEAVDYWRQVDLYLGGPEHATGHLLYVRFWTKFLYDIGRIPVKEPAKKLINQGMIQGRSNFVYRVKGSNTFVSYGLKDQYDTTSLHVDVNIVQNDILDTEKFKAFNPDYAHAEFILEEGKYICGFEVEKMSKSRFNVVNPDIIIEQYGADTLRMYEMFLGPLEQSKPWNTNGIEGVFKFLRKFWKLFFDDSWNFRVSEEKATAGELKALHKLIKKVEDDVERFSFNTSVSNFMICVNELTALACHKRAILQDLVIVLASYAPHICEELWERLGNAPGSLSYASYPRFNEAYLKEDSFEYPVSVNGKVRTKMNFALDMDQAGMEKEILSAEAVQRYLEGKPPKKIIIVKGRIVNVVV